MTNLKICRFSFEPVGVIHSPLKIMEGAPIQPRGADGINGTIEIFNKYEEGLADLAEFSHIFVIYYFHKITETKLKIKPYLDDKEHGIFAVRAPKRPNKIGLSVVKLQKIENNILFIQNLDMLDETPVLDIKHYIPDFDVYEVEKIGWITNKSQDCKKTKDDGRYILNEQNT